MTPPSLPERALVIREPWISLILDGRKTWELRGSGTARRGIIALVASGTGLVLGQANLTGSIGPLTRRDLADNEAAHAVSLEWETETLPYRQVHAWVLDEAIRYPKPIPYIHPRGAVIWVKLA